MHNEQQLKCTMSPWLRNLLTAFFSVCHLVQIKYVFTYPPPLYYSYLTRTSPPLNQSRFPPTCRTPLNCHLSYEGYSCEGLGCRNQTKNSTLSRFTTPDKLCRIRDLQICTMGSFTLKEHTESGQFGRTH